MKLLAQFLFIIPFFCNSQQLDSIAKHHEENFFGTVCSQDTVIINFGNEQCILYKLEDKVCRMKKGRILWTVDLKSEFNNPKIESVCIWWWSGVKKPRNIRIKVLTNNNNVEWSLDLKFNSGNVLRKYSLKKD